MAKKKPTFVQYLEIQERNTDGFYTNSAYASRYRNMFYKMAAGRFKMKLPKEIFLPRLLHSFIAYGWALFTEITPGRYYFGDFVGGGTLNIYNEPIVRDVVFPNGKRIRRTADNSVIVRLNSEIQPDLPIINTYAQQLGQLDEANDTNQRACHTPVIIYGDEKDIEKLQQKYNEIDGNVPYIALRGEDKFASKFSVFDLKPTYYVDKNQEQKTHLISECSTMLGIVYNVPKGERMIVDEVKTSNAHTETIRYDMWQNVSQGFENINDKFAKHSDKKLVDIALDFGDGSMYYDNKITDFDKSISNNFIY